MNDTLSDHDRGLAAARLLPTVTPETEAFWTGGASGSLQILRCQSCGLWLHPPTLICRRCQSESVQPEAVSGKGVVFSYTVNYHPFNPAVPVPYAIAIVELPEQPALRMTTNIVRCDPTEVRIGMPVRVMFEEHEDMWVPVFEPDTERPDS